MSEFLKSISETEIDEVTNNAGKKKNTKLCLIQEANLAAAMATCLNQGDSCSCSMVARLSDLIGKNC